MVSSSKSAHSQPPAQEDQQHDRVPQLWMVTLTAVTAVKPRQSSRKGLVLAAISICLLILGWAHVTALRVTSQRGVLGHSHQRHARLLADTATTTTTGVQSGAHIHLAPCGTWHVASCAVMQVSEARQQQQQQQQQQDRKPVTGGQKLRTRTRVLLAAKQSCLQLGSVSVVPDPCASLSRAGLKAYCQPAMTSNIAD